MPDKSVQSEPMNDLLERASTVRIYLSHHIEYEGDYTEAIEVIDALVAKAFPLARWDETDSSYTESQAQGPSFTHQDVEDCYLAATQYEESAKRYVGEKHGGLTAEAHNKIATRLRKLAGRIQAWLPKP